LKSVWALFQVKVVCDWIGDLVSGCQMSQKGTILEFAEKQVVETITRFGT